MPGESSRAPRPSKPSWKSDGGSSSRPGRSNREWTRGPKPEAERKLPRSRTLRIATAAVLFAASVALIIMLILWIRPVQPGCVVLIGADYATNLTTPPNVFGFEGLLGIHKLKERSRRYSVFGPRPLRLLQPEHPLVLDKSDDWDKLIETLTTDLAKKRIEEPTLIFVLSLNGVSDPDQGPYLLPNSAKGPEDRLPVRKVIQDLGKLKGKNKLLILEAAWAPSDWQRGMLQNDFARQLKDLEREIAQVPDLWVMSAAGPDERCWASEGLRRTIFTHFLIEGLAGRAAGTGRRINLDELFEYVRGNVRNLSLKTRGAVQEPVLLPHVDASGKKYTNEEFRERAQRLELIATGVPSEFKAPQAPDTQGLDQEWETFKTLAAADPSPAIYTPRQWRAYRALLVRYDELVRAGATNPAAEIKGRLKKLKQNIEEGRTLSKLATSVGNSLVFNAIQGGPVDDPSPSGTDFGQFWTASDASLEKVWQSLKGEESSRNETRRRLLRARVDHFLIGRGAQDASGNLEAAARRLGLTRENDIQPAEAHFLRMLNGNLRVRNPESPVWEPVQRSLEVRRLAERAALGVGEKAISFQYCEQVQPWIEPLIVKADDQRRQAEDLIFSTAKNGWSLADQSLAEAGALYKRAVNRAQPIRAALLVRDQVLADLPEYSRWLAHRLPSKLDDSLADTVEAVWENTHKLIKLLDAPNARVGDAPENNADLDMISLLVRDVERGFADIQKEFASQEIDQERKDGGDWDAVSAAAAVTCFHPDADDVELHRKFRQRLVDIGKRDIVDAQLEKTSTTETSSGQPVQATETVQQRAEIEGRMALAVLGRPWYDDTELFRKDQDWDYERIANNLRNFRKDEKDPWHVALAKVGSKIGLRWQKLLPVMDIAFTETGKLDAASVLARLRVSDRCSRLLDGARAEADDSREATARYRERLVHNLLIWLAGRTWLDHWYDEEPKSSPYYKIAGGKYIDDAERLVPGSLAVKQAREQLNQPSELALMKSKAVVWTSEVDRPISYQIEEVGKVPPGSPVVAASPGDFLDLNQAEEDVWRVAPRGTGEQLAQVAAFSVTSPFLKTQEEAPTLTKPEIRDTNFDVKGFFRGQEFHGRTEVQIHPLPEIHMLGPDFTNRPGAIAVRAQRDVLDQFGVGNGAITIVLDCSGSMRELIGNQSKIVQARQALNDVLATIPPGTTLSLWTFSQARGNQVVDENHPRPEDVEDSKAPERTIQRLYGPLAWDPARRPDLVRRLDQLKPTWQTPLVESMVRAKVDLAKAKGFRTMLVLTDGADSRFSKTHPGVEIAKFLGEQFRDTGIVLNMILYSQTQAELQGANKQFGVALGQLDPPGKLVSVKEVSRLRAELQSALKQQLAFKVFGDNARGKTLAEHTVTDAENEPNDWLTLDSPTDTYRIQVQTDRVNECSVVVKRGERLVVNLVSKPGQPGIAFERALFSDDFNTEKSSKLRKDAGNWRLAFLENKAQIGTNRLQLFATLEPKTTETDYLSQRKPYFTWFSLSSEFGKNEDGDFAVRWRERSLYPGPAWQFDVPSWALDLAGNPSRPTATVWWNPYTDPEPVATLTRQAGNFSAPLAINELKVQVGALEEVVIESVRFEEHLVDLRPGAKPEPCLVVRLRYPKGKPHWIDPKNLGIETPRGYAHRFYTRANRYTGLFWPVTRETIEKELTVLSLVSLERFKERAREGKFTMELPLQPPVRENQLDPPPPPKVGD
jgi:hypothetical protein